MRKYKASCLICILLICLCGCGAQKQDADTTSVLVGKKGEITQVIVEDFSQAYYNADELKSEIETKASQYNSQKGTQDGIVLKSLEVSDNKQIKVVIAFAGSQEYTDFNEKNLFSGKVSDAYNAGYTFPNMKGADGQMLTQQAVLEKGEMNILITEESQQVCVPAKIAYMSDGVTLVDEKTAMNLNEGQVAYIIY